MHNRTFKIKAAHILNPYTVAEKGEKRVKKRGKRTMNKYRRTLEKREIRTVRSKL